MNSIQKMLSNTSTHINSIVEKTCPLCQKKFIPKGRQKYCDGPHFKPCPVCGTPVPAPYPSDPARCCSSECRKQLKYSNKLGSKQEEKDMIENKCPVTANKIEYIIDDTITLTTEPLEIMDKGTKCFFTKECIFDTKIKGIIKGHTYDIEVTKNGYTYDVLITYDHTYREDIHILFNIASAISFNNYFK